LGPLAERHDVLAFDLPGFGESDRPPPSKYGYGPAAFARDVLGVLDRLGIESFALLGHSMGGGVALAMARLVPKRVRALVLECALVEPAPLHRMARFALIPGVGPLLFQTAGHRQIAHELRQRVYSRNHPVPQQAIEECWQFLHQRPGGAAAACATFRALCRLPALSETAPAASAPTLCVWGENDALIPLRHGRRLARALAAPLRIVPATGHIPHEERPAEVLRVVLPFLSRAHGFHQGEEMESCPRAS
jgi:pimeloyl-ACP methyl ester carboxylesterase